MILLLSKAAQLASHWTRTIRSRIVMMQILVDLHLWDGQSAHIAIVLPIHILITLILYHKYTWGINQSLTLPFHILMKQIVICPHRLKMNMKHIVYPNIIKK